MTKPCLSKEVINFDNLSNFLDFLETKSRESSFEINEHKEKTSSVDQIVGIMKNQITDFKKITDSINPKITYLNNKLDQLSETLESSIYRLNDFELKSKKVI